MWRITSFHRNGTVAEVKHYKTYKNFQKGLVRAQATFQSNQAKGKKYTGHFIAEYCPLPTWELIEDTRKQLEQTTND